MSRAVLSMKSAATHMTCQEAPHQPLLTGWHSSRQEWGR